MRRRDPEVGLTYQERAYITNNPRIKDAIAKRQSGAWFDVRAFSELELFHIELECRKKDEWFEPHIFTKLWNEHRPKLLAPVGTDKTGDFVEAWSQPEAVELFDDWWDREIRPRDNQSYEAAKAMLLIAGGMRKNLRDAHDDLKEKQRLLGHFNGLTKGTRRSKRHPRVPPMIVQDYSAMTRLLPKLGRAFPDKAMEANMKIIRQLAEMFPHLGIGKDIAIDGMLVPYWCPQGSAKEHGVLNEAKEARYNRGYERIGFKAIGYDADGQFNDSDDDKKRKKKVKSCRGGLFVLLVEVVTGLPLVGVLLPADSHETHALYELLPKLYGFWPEIPLETIVGDKLYDARDLHRFCEVGYGVHLTAVRKPSHNRKNPETYVEQGGMLLNEKQSERLAMVDGRGVAFCRSHGEGLVIESIDTPNRAKLKRSDGSMGLLPGEEAPESLFRYRYADKSHDENSKGWCGRPTLKMSLDWSQFAYHPHNGYSPFHKNDPRSFPYVKRYNRRLVLEAIGRNQSEAAFASLQTGYGVGLKGSGRTRVRDDYVYESLIWAALLTRSLKMIACERAHLAATASAATPANTPTSSKKAA